MVFNSAYNPYTSNSLGNSPRSEYSSDITDSLTPAQLLALAIKKRRQLIETKERDIRRELLHSTMIQTLCKFLGSKAARKRQRRPRRKTIKWHWSEYEKGSRDQDQLVPDSGLSPNHPESGFDSDVQSDHAHQQPSHFQVQQGDAGAIFVVEDDDDEPQRKRSKGRGNITLLDLDHHCYGASVAHIYKRLYDDDEDNMDIKESDL